MSDIEAYLAPFVRAFASGKQIGIATQRLMLSLDEDLHLGRITPTEAQRIEAAWVRHVRGTAPTMADYDLVVSRVGDVPPPSSPSSRTLPLGLIWERGGVEMLTHSAETRREGIRLRTILRDAAIGATPAAGACRAFLSATTTEQLDLALTQGPRRSESTGMSGGLGMLAWDFIGPFELFDSFTIEAFISGSTGPRVVNVLEVHATT